MDGRGTVSRQVRVVGIGQRARRKKAGHSTTSRGVCLHHVDTISCQHRAHVVQHVVILARGNLHRCRNALAQQSEMLEIVAGDGFLKPSDVMN